MSSSDQKHPKDAPEESRGQAVTPYEWLGGYPVIEKVMHRFVQMLRTDQLLERHFGGISMQHAEHLTLWFTEILGGPTVYTDSLGGFRRMQGMHRNRDITETERRRWVELFTEACDAEDVPSDPEFRSTLEAYIAWASRKAMANSVTGSPRPPRTTMPIWGWGQTPPGTD
jgi:hemoglobin